MRASVTAARLKYRMLAICHFGPAPLEDRMSALRRVKRWRRCASRRAMSSRFQDSRRKLNRRRRLVQTAPSCSVPSVAWSGLTLNLSGCEVQAL